MKLKSIMTLAIAAAFALPAAAQMSPRTDTTTGGPLTSGTNSADRPANTPKSESGAGASTAPSSSVPSTTAPSTTGSAASGSSSAAGGFSGIDRNGDGFISRDEARDATWSNRFAELDKDNDGRLSRSEFDAMGDSATGTTSGGVSSGHSGSGASTTGGMGGSVGPAGTQSGSSTSGVGDKPGQKQ
jgi:hypothetical protein